MLRSKDSSTPTSLDQQFLYLYIVVFIDTHTNKSNSNRFRVRVRVRVRVITQINVESIGGPPDTT